MRQHETDDMVLGIENKLFAQTHNEKGPDYQSYRRAVEIIQGRRIARQTQKNVRAPDYCLMLGFVRTLSYYIIK